MGALIDAGADLDARDGDGWSAAMRAAAWGRIDNLELLARRGADLDLRDPEGTTVHDIARANSHSPNAWKCVAFLNSLQCAQELAATSASPATASRPARI